MQNKHHELDIFYLFFGILRQSIIAVEPKMKTILLDANHRRRLNH
ncbi:hypothetical protein SynRCC2555_00646 [Synechococcus sp. WH 8101]|nr:hypothetical protein SynRCC2555_00646 [Synechococcus sp. WH 8101]